jgi:hypothetical protein
MKGTVAAAGLARPIAMTGRIAYDANGMSRGTVTFPNPKTGELVKLEAVQDETHVYMRSSSFGTLPEGKEWMGLDLSFGDEIETPFPGGSDAKGELELLEKVSGGVDRIGREKVCGVMTTGTAAGSASLATPSGCEKWALTPWPQTSKRPAHRCRSKPGSTARGWSAGWRLLRPGREKKGRNRRPWTCGWTSSTLVTNPK